MTNILIVFPRIEDAKSIRNLLVKSGYRVAGVCSTGAQAISQADGLGGGIVICSYKLADMLYAELHECLLPFGFEMLLMASGHQLTECLDNDIVCLSMPLKVHDLLNTVDMMAENQQRQRRRKRTVPRERDTGEVKLIQEAKELLMSRNNMMEEEAYRYIQKCSMDSGTNMAETAQMILLMKGEG